MQLSEVIAAVTSAGGFDTSSTATSDTVIRGWISESVLTALAESEYRRARLELGPTVADQADYDIPENVVRVRALRVNGSAQWTRLEQLEDLWALEQSSAAVLGSPGAFVANFGDDGDADADEDTKPVLTLWPTPTVAGLSIQGICAVVPAEITAATLTTYVIPLPTDVVRPIAVDGAIRLGKLQVDEREDLAAPFQARYEAAVARLSRRAKSRIGGGPGQARLVRPRVV